jgi:hypothetical protein
VGACRFEQHVGALDVGLDEVARAVDRAVDVRLGGEVDHAGRPVGDEQLVQCRAVADVGVAEHMARVAGQVRERFEVAGVGQLVDVDDAPVAFGDQQANQGGADEAGAAGDEEGFHVGAGGERKRVRA